MNLYMVSGCEKANIKHKQFKPIKNLSEKNKQMTGVGEEWEERADESFLP